MINEGLLKLAVKRIEADPEFWNQDYFGRVSECGTTFCLAGHALMVTGKCETFKISSSGDLGFTIDGDRINAGVVAAELLGLDSKQAAMLFYMGDRGGLKEFKQFITEVTGVRFDG